MANSWPAVSGSTPGYTATGVTTIRWGTDGVLQSPKPSSGFYTVLRANQRTLIDNIKLPNGTGPTITRVQVLDGSVWDLTVRDDSNMAVSATPGPIVGYVVTITDMGGLISGNMSSSTPGHNVGSTFTATVIDSGYEAAPKQAGERTITVENLLLIESQQGGAGV